VREDEKDQIAKKRKKEREKKSSLIK